MVDEAYFEFSKSSYANLVEKYNNMIVIRSMSKWAGLAGLRVGYGLMSKELAKLFMGVKNPYNVSTVAEESLIVSLKYSLKSKTKPKVVSTNGPIFGFLYFYLIQKK